MKEPTLVKALGQHHLRHPGLCRPLIEFLAPQGEPMLEVGPGGGLLTTELLKTGSTVLGVELDVGWSFLLRRRLASPRLSVAAADALRLEWRRLPQGALVTGNLPFGIATALIENLLSQARGVPRAAFLVQQEVAHRLVARPGQRAYGSFTVLVQACAETRLLATVKPGSFRPPPKVKSSFVGLTLHPPPFPWEELADFKATVRQAFRQRRKTLYNALAGAWGKKETTRVLGQVGLDGSRRADNLPLAVFVELHRARLGRDLGRNGADPNI